MKKFTQGRSQIIVKEWPTVKVDRSELSKQLSEYLEGGGKIQRLPTRYCSESININLDHGFFKTHGHLEVKRRY